MSYRTYVNGKQIFGNNEWYPEWITFIQENGIEIDEEGCYEGQITDFMGALTVVENITLRIAKEREKKNKELREIRPSQELVETFDWTNIPKEIEKQNKSDRFRTSLFDNLCMVIQNGYAFMPYALYLACENKLERTNPFTVDGHFDCFKVKDGEFLVVRGG